MEPLYSEFAEDPEMAELLELYAVGLEESITKLKDALEAGNIDDARRLAHQLKGSGGGYGFAAITAAAADLEAVLRTPVPVLADTQPQFQALALVCRRAQLGIARRQGQS